ncbi:sirohydrochlorin cobaltochelatase [Kitasatospora sp. MAP12-15]|uniref:sirohydrochlorin chelatase n=1 Tax=unclassified Kitasatospora TaxID=2633591 RepID=UPI0024741CC8|nr:cobalamin biosynthesis protein CbiX [Kitasatospora sp. MAP12-44]MDH6109642.1 sirohydrochlorin cobaltochelatase [Kitasatospora sp. MAP12-44]
MTPAAAPDPAAPAPGQPAATLGPAAATLVLVTGHESGGPAALRPLVGGDPAVLVVPVGRALGQAVTDALAQSERPVCVVPMTLGRDPSLVADTARALHWLTGAEPARRARIALAEPFGTASHLIGWLRAAAGRTAGARREDCAILVTAPPSGPFQDAELFRIARLVSRHGTHRRVEVAFDGGDPGLAEGVERCRRLGARRVVLLPAGFGPAARRPVQGAEDGGPLLGPPAVAAVLRARTASALHRLGHGQDGIAAALDAEHGHGYAHSHGPGEDHRHQHQTPHTHQR